MARRHPPRHLGIGEVMLLRRAEDVVWTVLGSCVSIIFHVPCRISLICHAQMPARRAVGAQCFDDCPEHCFEVGSNANDLKFVTCAIRAMVGQLERLEIPLSAVHVTLVGGAAIIGTGQPRELTVGWQNVEAARRMFARYGITVHRQCVAGSSGMTLRYHHADNGLMVRFHGGEEFELAPDARIEREGV